MRRKSDLKADIFVFQEAAGDGKRRRGAFSIRRRNHKDDDMAA